jgi:hypothetical protein
MTPAAFARLALALPEAEAASHVGQSDARVKGKIFASRLEAADGTVTLKLRPEQQEMLCAAEPQIFAPVAGGWGAKGWTTVRLRDLDEATARSALAMAWRNVVPARLLKLHPG